MCLTLLLSAVIAALAGCAPSTTLPNPDGWPAELSGRKLYHTPSAYIYATSDAAAGEIDRRLADVVAEFQKATGVKLEGKPLLLVTDASDPALFADEESFGRVLERHERLSKEQPSGASSFSTGSLDQHKEIAKQTGLPLEGVLKMMPLPLVREDLCDELKLPPLLAEATRWQMAVPTEAATGVFTGKMIDVQMKDLNVGQKIMVAPMLPMMYGMMKSMAVAMNKVVLFGVIGERQSGLDKDALHPHMEQYAKSEMKKALGIFGGLVDG